jgi:hypothetical protein
MSYQLSIAVGLPDKVIFAQPKSLISLSASFFLDEYRVVFAVNVTFPMRVLLAGAGAMSPEPLSLLLPTRQANLFCWCLHQGMRAIKPMTLMTMGHYQEPGGCYFPSVLY